MRTGPNGKERLALAAILAGAYLLCSAAAALAVEELYGGIEIGAKGVKATVVRVTPSAAGNDVRIVMAQTANTSIAAGVLKKGKFSPDSIKDTTEEVDRFYRLMLKDKDVPKSNIHIVGSSGIPQAENRDDLVAAIREKTGLTMKFISLKDEIELSLLGIVPAGERTKALYLDIGSGNTKGGCYETAGADAKPTLVTLSLPLGTVTYTERVKKEAGEDFLAGVMQQAKTLLEEPLEAQVKQTPRLSEPTLVYFSGGIVWAMVTFMRPETINEAYVTISADDFEKFAALLAKDPTRLPVPDLSAIGDPMSREALAKDVRRVKDTFTRENLIAGTAIMRALADKLELKSKTLRFARNGYVAWIAGYVVPGER
jgi:exopolyphosphatase/pppGpp-phosphohydrolase